MTPSAPLPFSLIFKEQTGSTNTDAIEYAKAGADDYTLVWALSQSAGVGRFERRWVSDVGNLFWSAILNINSDKPKIETLALPIAIVIGSAIRSIVATDTSVEYKWPNDVLVNGRKISGTLSSGGYDTGWLVVGIGINVNIRPDLTNAIYEATCLSDEMEQAPSVQEVCTELCNNFYRIVEYWRRNGFDLYLHDEYERYMWKLGEKITVYFNSEKTEGITGINRGIDEDGALLLENESGVIVKIYAGDVGAA